MAIAHHHHHARPRTAPHWATTRMTAARRLRVVRHAPFVAYTAATLAAAGYVLAQLVQL